MALTGMQFDAYLNNAYIPRVHSMTFWNSWWLNQPYFEVVQPEGSNPGGAEINGLLDYSETTNAEVYVRGAPIPDPDSTDTIRYYHNKDYFQATAKVYGDQMSQTRGFDALNVPITPETKAIDTSVKNLVDLMSTTFLTDLAAQVDSTTAYSDASLSRATYNCASYEVGSVSGLALADMEDMLEALQNTTYGIVPNEDLVWVMARNQLTNISRLTSGASNFGLNASSQDMAAIDAGRVMRTIEFEGVPIFVVPNMTNSEMYLLKRSATKIYLHETPKTVLKDPAEWAMQYLSTAGANLVIEDPLRCGKLTGITA